MKILKTQTLRGPNYWSIRHKKLIVIRLDLEALADRLTNEMTGFHDGLAEVLPSLVEHHCSPLRCLSIRPLPPDLRLRRRHHLVLNVPLLHRLLPDEVLPIVPSPAPDSLPWSNWLKKPTIEDFLIFTWE